MKIIVFAIVFISLAPTALALNYGSYQNDSCGVLDAFKVNFHFKRDGGKFIEIKEECSAPTEERKAQELKKDDSYNEYETYKRMLYYDSVDF